MRFVSPLLKNVIYPGLSRTGCLRLLPHDRPVVLTYHGIFPEGYRMRHPALDGHLISAAAFRAQMERLRSRYHLITPDEFLAWSEGRLQLPSRSVLLTCDDGLLNTVANMLPVVRELQLPFLFFLTAASAAKTRSMLWYEKLFLWLIERPGEIRCSWRSHPYIGASPEQMLTMWRAMIEDLSCFSTAAREPALHEVRTQLGISESWEASYSQQEPLRRRFFMMNVDDMKELAQAGVAIGAHTLSHPMLSKMPSEVACTEMVESRSQLEAALCQPVWAFAYPFGDSEAVSNREPELAARAGYKCAFTNTETDWNGDRFLFPRLHVSHGTQTSELEARIAGLHHALRVRFNGRGARLAG